MTEIFDLHGAHTPPPPREGRSAERVAVMSRAYNDGERKLAEHVALEILDQAPGQRDALGALYNVCKDEQRMTAAEALVKRIAVLYPNDTTSQLVAVRFFISKGDYPAAHRYARMLVRL